MKCSRKKIFALLAALALVLSMLAACGGQSDEGQDADPAPVEDAAEPVGGNVPPEEDASGMEHTEAPEPEDGQEEEPAADDTQPEESEIPEEQPAEPVSAPVEPEERQPEPESEPEPELEPAPALTVPEDGSYTASVVLEGGTGRASVESPAVLYCKDGKFYAAIVWSSPNYDYMKVDGERYEPVNTEGNSVFEIPVAAFDQKLDVIADTVAMSEPHEVEYTLYFDSATLQKQ